MKQAFVVTTVIVMTFLTACAALPERIDQLEQARAEVQALGQDPLAVQAASRELQSARAALQQADNAKEEGEPLERIVHLAYLAQRRAEIGQARIAEARAREQIAQAEADRNRVLLEARERQARQAEQRAQRQTEEADMAREDALAARSELESAQEQLRELEAEQTQRGMVLTLSDVLFDTDRATLKPGATAALDRLSQFLTENDQTRIIIEGHTDSRGSDSYNQDLSRRRAQAVADELIARGVPRDRFETIGRGEQYPVANNDTAAGRQQNRRVEIVFSDAAGRFAQGARDSALR